jgi:hypothetical protein
LACIFRSRSLRSCEVPRASGSRCGPTKMETEHGQTAEFSSKPACPCPFLGGKPPSGLPVAPGDDRSNTDQLLRRSTRTFTLRLSPKSGTPSDSPKSTFSLLAPPHTGREPRTLPARSAGLGHPHHRGRPAIPDKLNRTKRAETLTHLNPRLESKISYVAKGKQCPLLHLGPAFPPTDASKCRFCGAF